MYLLSMMTTGCALVFTCDDCRSGLCRGDAAVIFEALAYGDVSTTAYLTIHNMVRFQTAPRTQRDAFIPACALFHHAGRQRRPLCCSHDNNSTWAARRGLILAVVNVRGAPNAGLVGDRHVRQRRAAAAVPAAPDGHGAARGVLPDGARLRQRRGVAADRRTPRWLRLRPHRWRRQPGMPCHAVLIRFQGQRSAGAAALASCRAGRLMHVRSCMAADDGIRRAVSRPSAEQAADGLARRWFSGVPRC